MGNEKVMIFWHHVDDDRREATHNHGSAIENTSFKMPDSDGSTNMKEHLEKVCERADKEFPMLHHWVEVVE